MALALEGRASSTPDDPHVKTSGRARISAPADSASLSVTAQATDRSAEVAKNKVEGMVSQFLGALSGLGVGEQNLVVGGVSLERELDWRGDREVELRYTAERKIRVNVGDTKQIDPVLQSALQSGISQMDSVQYAVSNWHDLKQRARAMAIMDAKQKANFFAEQFGTCLGGVWSIDTSRDRDDGTYEEILVTARRAESTRRVPQYVPGDYESGRVDITAEVAVVFTLSAGKCP